MLTFLIQAIQLVCSQETRVREFEFGKIQIGHASASVRAFHLRKTISNADKIKILPLHQSPL